MSEQKIHGLSGLAHYSPVTHGYTEFALEVENGKVISAKPLLGSMHRGAEKLFESRDYRQILMLANRHEWLGSIAGELGVAQLVEDALVIEVPQAAQWLRTLLLEYTRVTSHLAFIAGFPWADESISQAIRVNRELWISHNANYTGNRMHSMITRIGGLSHAPTSQWLEDVTKLCASTKNLISDLKPKISSELAQYVGVGVLTRQDAIEFAVSGPVARASGYQIDFRNQSRGLKYDELAKTDFEFSSGDVSARLEILIAEVIQSISWLEELLPTCIANVDNPIDVLLPKVIRVPEGVYEHQLETPLGLASWLLVSHNDKMPHRLKLRPASLHTVLSLEKVLIGVDEHLVDVVIASMPFISGDVDR